MLVLLVFGLLIFFADHIPEFHSSAEATPSYWLEFRSDHPALMRFDDLNDIQKMLRNNPIPGYDVDESRIMRSPTGEMFRENRMFALEISHNGQLKQTKISPRLLFILKQQLPLNDANLEDLKLVPGIGPYLANNINRYHIQNGKIRNTSELMLVPGIGKSRAAKIAPYLSFE